MNKRLDLWMANAVREIINESLARYDIPSDVYEADLAIDGDCVRLADDLLNRLAAETEQAKTLYRETLHRAVKAEAETARLRSLMGRYVAHVGTEEGTDFLYRSSDWITEAEADELWVAGVAARKPGEQL